MRLGRDVTYGKYRDALNEPRTIHQLAAMLGIGSARAESSLAILRNLKLVTQNGDTFVNAAEAP